MVKSLENHGVELIIWIKIQLFTKVESIMQNKCFLCLAFGRDSERPFI